MLKIYTDEIDQLMQSPFEIDLVRKGLINSITVTARLLSTDSNHSGLPATQGVFLRLAAASASLADMEITVFRSIGHTSENLIAAMMSITKNNLHHN